MTRLFMFSLCLFAASVSIAGEKTKIEKLDEQIESLSGQIDTLDGKIAGLKEQSTQTRSKIKELEQQQQRLTADAKRLRSLDLTKARKAAEQTRNVFLSADKNSAEPEKQTAFEDAEKAYLDAGLALREAEARFAKEINEAIALHNIPEGTADVPGKLDELAAQLAREIAELKAKDTTDELRELRDERDSLAQEQVRQLSFRNSLALESSIKLQNETKTAVVSVSTDVKKQVDGIDEQRKKDLAAMLELLKSSATVADVKSVERLVGNVEKALEKHKENPGKVKEIEKRVADLVEKLVHEPKESAQEVSKKAAAAGKSVQTAPAAKPASAPKATAAPVTTSAVTPSTSGIATASQSQEQVYQECANGQCYRYVIRNGQKVYF